MTYLKAGVHSSDLIHYLKGEGFAVEKWRLRHAAKKGHIPSPTKTHSGDLTWRPDDVPVIKKYFQNPKRQGRPKLNK